VDRTNIKSFLLTMLIAGAGGAAFAVINFPLAWLLGAMLATTVCSLAGMAVYVPDFLRIMMIAVLGIMLGSVFSPDMIASMANWAVPLVLLGLFVLVVTFLGAAYFRRVAGYDRVTSFFSATPGGMTEMALVAESYGADIRVISLGHAVRVLITVGTIPLWFRFVQGLDVPAMPATGTGFADLELFEIAALTGCGIVGVVLGDLLKIPAGRLVGPMVLSALVHMVGWVHAAPPPSIVAVAQVVIGASIGLRFVGLTMRDLRGIALHAATVSIGFVILAVVCGNLLAPMVDLPSVAMVLALAPGGLSEMSLVALAIGVETAFVSSMHIARIIMIVIAAPLVFRLTHRDVVGK